MRTKELCLTHSVVHVGCWECLCLYQVVPLGPSLVPASEGEHARDILHGHISLERHMLHPLIVCPLELSHRTTLTAMEADRRLHDARACCFPLRLQTLRSQTGLVSSEPAPSPGLSIYHQSCSVMGVRKNQAEKEASALTACKNPFPVPSRQSPGP